MNQESPTPGVPQDEPDEALYQIVAARRAGYDSMMWQTPVLSLTAQAFLLTIALGAGSSRLARALSGALALISSLASIQLMLKHRYMEVHTRVGMGEAGQRLARSVEFLSPDVEFNVPQDIQPLYVTQYFSQRRDFGSVDPRQHAIGLIFAVPIAGVLRTSGEAISFRWFHPSKLPAAEEIGFDQHDVLVKCVARLSLMSAVPSGVNP